MNTKHKAVIVSGAGKGLGLEITKQLLEQEYKVIAVSRTHTSGIQKLENQYVNNIAFYAFDFMQLDDISALVKTIVSAHGRPFGLINNAAIGNDGVLGTMHEQDISKIIRINIEAPILMSKYVSRSMLLNKQGRIINVGSIIGSTGFSGLSVYAASKAAMQGFTKSLARELGKANITVNTLAPGYMQTSMTQGLQGDKLSKIERRSPLGRLANVEDAAQGALYLLSDGAKSITGSTLTIDAGSTA